MIPYFVYYKWWARGNQGSGCCAIYRQTPVCGPGDIQDMVDEIIEINRREGRNPHTVVVANWRRFEDPLSEGES